MSKVAVVGGCGRLGLRLSLVLANKGHNVTSIDIDDERINEIKQGNLPFIEQGAEIYLEQALKNKSLNLTTEYDAVSQAEVIIITIGTPVDSNLNPSLEPVAGVIFDLSEHFKKGQLIVFRNTISPRILNRIKVLVEDKTGLKVGRDIYLVFAPEITRGEVNINDIASVPQPIGAFDEQSYNVAHNFFSTITKGKITFLTPQEAMLSKLMQNMYAYIQQASGNQFYLIAESFNANIHKIIDASSSPTSHLPSPNPNGAGPGMHKEGWFLVDRIPFSELITTAFKLNESMPAYIVQKLENLKVNKVAILGMTNKANSDDVRASLSYKLRKLLYYQDYNVACYDPYLPEYSDSGTLHGADVVILMTPHDEFKDIEKVKELVRNPNCVFIDLHGAWKETRENAINGILNLSLHLNLK